MGVKRISFNISIKKLKSTEESRQEVNTDNVFLLFGSDKTSKISFTIIDLLASVIKIPT